MKEITRNGLRFPLEEDDYEIPAELGEELMQLNQDMVDENREAFGEAESGERVR